MSGKINTTNLRADAVKEIGIARSLGGDPSPFAAVAIVCCDEIDRLRADVAAMLPIVEAVGNVTDARVYPNRRTWEVSDELRTSARAFLDARNVGP